MNFKYMKRISYTFSIVSFFLLTAGSASAQMGMMNYYWQNNSPVAQSGQSSTISAALQDIYSSQSISAQSQVICAQVTDTQFEKLGDAVMGYGITEQQHAVMENMMGGEGSATLKQAHINLGRSYLGCWSNYRSGPVTMPMMGYFYGSSTPTTYGQNNSYSGPWGMMGYAFNSGWSNWITTILLWTLLLLGSVTLVKRLRKNR